MNFLVVGMDFPPNRGGISAYTKELAVALKRKNRVIVLAPGVRKAAVFDQAYPVQVIRTPAVPVLRLLSFFIYLPVLLWRFRIDVALHTVWPTSLVSYIWHFILPIPYFVSVHASEILDDKTSWRRRLKGYLKPWRHAALNKAKGIFPVSRYSARLMNNLGIDQSRIHIISNGVDPGRFKPRKTQRPVNEPPKILTTARLDLHKGHDHVLEALFILKKQGMEPRYIIVGEGEEKGRLRSLVQRLKLENQVVFYGYASENQLAEVYADCDIFVMASREILGRPDLVEGFGISFLEASASGLPVVAGRSGGVPDAVRDQETGLLVNPDAPEEIARALALLLSDTDFAQKLGAEGRRWTETQMSWEHVAQRLCSTIQRLIGLESGSKY